MTTSKRLDTQFLLKDREVTEDIYNDMLGVVPPITMVCNAFLVGEIVRYNAYHALYQMYFTHEGKYYDGGIVSVKDFNSFLI